VQYTNDTDNNTANQVPAKSVEKTLLCYRVALVNQLYCIFKEKQSFFPSVHPFVCLSGYIQYLCNSSPSSTTRGNKMQVFNIIRVKTCKLSENIRCSTNMKPTWIFKILIFVTIISGESRIQTVWVSLFHPLHIDIWVILVKAEY
jgi:hypothetical protein